ncbi:hypothetical protein BGX28_007800 [Mortierella sp. GBA30]|nr:hypothetical protein BGX28_007800 [Mortierella sp. GBA30]
MADVTNTVVSLVASISRAASRARVNKKSCYYLSLKCNNVLKRLESGELGPKDDPRLEELVATLGACRADLTKFSGLGFLMRLIRSGDIPEINNEHSKNLDLWLSVATEKLSDEVLREDTRAAIRFKREVISRQNAGIAILKSDAPISVTELPVVIRDKLVVGEEVGKFPFGTIFKGVYKGKPVYIREVSRVITGAHLDLIMTSIRLSMCLMDCQNIIGVQGICQGRMIVTDATTHGPLSEFSIIDDRQKVAIARKVADALLAIHDVATGNECVVHRDIRAANILIDQGPDANAELEPKITGFEMCKQSTSRTGKYPDIDERYRRWWSPERDISGTSIKSDVFAFGMLMYEISTGKEPEAGDLVEMEGMRICGQYTSLMERCLDTHYDARPSMDQVAQGLLGIENILMAELREP